MRIQHFGRGVSPAMVTEAITSPVTRAVERGIWRGIWGRHRKGMDKSTTGSGGCEGNSWARRERTRSHEGRDGREREVEKKGGGIDARLRSRLAIDGARASALRIDEAGCANAKTEEKRRSRPWSPHAALSHAEPWERWRVWRRVEARVALVAQVERKADRHRSPVVSMAKRSARQSR